MAHRCLRVILTVQLKGRNRRPGPTDAPATLAELADLAAGIAGVDSIRPRPLPRAVVSVGGLVVPILHALWETRHQFERPFVLDSSAAQARFGLEPTPLRRGLELTVEALRREAGAH